MRSVSPFVRVCCLLALFSLSVYGWSFSTQLLFSAPTGDEFPVIMHPASQEFPAIDGDLVVWQDARFGPAEIFLADLSSGEITNLTQTADTWEANPAISGDYVVWRDGYQGIGIHGLKLSTREPLTVTSGLREISRPRLSGSIVVWADNRRGDGDWNIYGYDLASGEDLRLAEQPGNQTDPQIDGNLVVWVDETTGIVVYNLTSKATITLTLGASAWSPAVSESAQLVVWQDYRHADWDIYGYDLAAQREFPIFVGAGEQVNAGLGDTLVVYQSRLPGAAWEIAGYAIQQQLALPITLNSSTELFPAVDGATVVWQDSRNHQLDIYGYTWDGLPPVQPSYPLLAPTFLQAGALPAGQIVVRWHDTNQDESGYKLERTAGITGTRWIDLATLPASSEVYTDTPGVEGESYWYRVRAFNPTGVSPYSNEDFNTTFEATPSGLELYLMVLINAVRADPAHFGYPEYEPVPPLSFNPLLSYSARSHSQAILNGIYQFGHCDPVGRCSLERAEAVGYTGAAYCVDNLIRGDGTYTSIEAANRSFLESEGHRKSMLNAASTEFAVGHVYDTAKGDAASHGNVIEVFCRRDSAPRQAIPGGVVVPDVGEQSITFTYLVNYYASDGQAPSQAEVVIDEQSYPLQLASGRPAHGTYQLVVTAPLASQHTYYFRITGPAGVHRWPATGYMTEANLFVADKPPIPTPAPGTPTPALTPTATATPTLTLTITPPATGGPFRINLPLISARQ